MCCGIAQQCRRVLLCSFAVGCEDSEDTGFCPLRIMWCAPEHSIFSICRFWEKRQLPANPVKSRVTAILWFFLKIKKIPQILFWGIFLCFWEHFWEIGGGGVSLPKRGGMAKINIHLQKLGNWFFTQIYFLIFFNSIKIDFLKILISQYFVFFFFQHFIYSKRLNLG